MKLRDFFVIGSFDFVNRFIQIWFMNLTKVHIYHLSMKSQILNILKKPIHNVHVAICMYLWRKY